MTAIRLSESPALASPEKPSPFQAGQNPKSANDARFNRLNPAYRRGFRVSYITPRGTLGRISLQADASDPDECVIGALRALRAHLRMQGCSELQLKEVRSLATEI